MPERIKKNKSLVYRLLLFTGLLFLMAGLVAGLAWFVKSVPQVQEKFDYLTVGKTETFTELYFEDHISLPGTIILFKENNFEFTIHNLENKNIEYQYEAYVDINGDKQVIEYNSVTIKNNEYKTIKESFIISNPANRVKVVVNLINKNQKIDFWMDQ